MTSAPNLRELSVLILDDNYFMRRLVENLCLGLGVGKVQKAKDVPRALDIMARDDIDLVITDWHMEPIDGLAFVRHLRNSPDSPDPFVPIIMLTGHGARERVEEARDNGVNLFMAKPVSAAALYERLVWLINNPLPFVRVGGYFGPDRRRKDARPPAGAPDRRARRFDWGLRKR